MKRMNFLGAFVLFLSALCLSGCNDDTDDYEIFDWAPVNLSVVVLDSDGNNLADPSFSDILKGTILEYKANEIPLRFTPSSQQPATKDYLPQDCGFRVEFYKFSNKGEYVLQYGELDGSKEYKDETFTIIWPDKSKDVITMSRKVNYKKNDATTQWTLNGSKCDPVIHITKSFHK